MKDSPLPSILVRVQPIPRGPRLDAPDTLHQVMARGIDRLFGSPADSQDVVARLDVGVEATGLLAVLRCQE